MKKRQRVRKTIAIMMFLLFPVIIFYFSPYLIIVGAVDGIITGSFIMFALLFLFSLLFGRAFCGYVCAVGGLQECLMPANSKQANGGRRNMIKYCIWVPWITAIVLLFLRAGGVKETDFFFHTQFGVSLYVYILHLLRRVTVGCRVVTLRRETRLLPLRMLDGPFHGAWYKTFQPV